MRKHSTALTAVVGIAAIALLTTACSSQSAAKPSASPSAVSNKITSPVTISLESYMPSLGTIGVDTLNQLVANFEKKNPMVTVKIVPDLAAGSTLVANYQREAATGTLPDVGQVTFDTMRFSASGLGALPLEDTYGKATTASFFGGEFPYYAPVAKLGVVGGKTYGVPWTLSTPVLFYNPTLLTAAGIATPPTNWDELTTDAAKIKTASGAAGLSMGCVGTQATSDWCLQAILSSNGGGVLKGDTVTFDSKANVQALTEMQKLGSTGVMPDLTTQQMVQQFATGKLAFILNTAALQGTLLAAVNNTFVMKDTAMPGFGSKPATPTNSGSALEVFSKTKIKQSADLALLQYLTSPEAETIITSQVGYPPLRDGVSTSAKYLKSFSDQHPLLAANVAQLKKIVPWQSYPGNNFIQIETLIDDSVAKAVYQNQSPAAELKSAQQQALALVG